MRCTRCDGVIDTQSVGHDPEGRVVFGWCLQCMADKKCRLVEVPGRNLRDLRLSFKPEEPTTAAAPRIRPAIPGGDRSQGAFAVVAIALISWGLVLLAAGLCWPPQEPGDANPMGNGTPLFLGVGGVAVMMLGLGLAVLGSRRGWLAGTLGLTLLSWFSLLIALGVLIHGLVRYDPRRKVGLILACGLALLISRSAQQMARSRARRAPDEAVTPLHSLAAPEISPRKRPTRR